MGRLSSSPSFPPRHPHCYRRKPYRRRQHIFSYHLFMVCFRHQEVGTKSDIMTQNRDEEKKKNKKRKRTLSTPEATKEKEENGNNQVTKKRKESFIYGNYRHYYGYRIGKCSNEDPRLAAFKREWFEGKDCLDIGCNQGLITISIAKRFSCRKIVGIDIDGDLIGAANRNLWKMSKNEIASSKKVYIADVSNRAPVSQENVSRLTTEDHAGFERVSPTNKNDLCKQVFFQKENFVEDLGCHMGKYDVVLCLSVSKWIHLNWGDDGIITLFVKIWRILRPGGILLLEPQPWKSYQKNRQVSETAKLNYWNILFTPDLFEEILLDKVGFRSVENVTVKLSGTVAGFDRPIFAFTK